MKGSEACIKDSSLVFGVLHMELYSLCYMKNLKRPIQTTNLFLLIQSWQVDIYVDYVNIDAFYPQGPFLYVSMAASSKFLAVCLTYPYQVVRARLQVIIES